MKVTKVEVEEEHRAVFESSAVEEIVEAVHAHRRLMAFLTQALRDYHDSDALTKRNPSLRRLATSLQRDKSEQGPMNTICAGLERLYREHDPGTARGVLIEALVQRTIQTRYGGGADLLENNLKFRVEHGDGRTHETSTSIDVIGVCATSDVGECIDCKVASKTFKPEWVEELTDDVAPFGFRIGLATADSSDRARAGLKRAGVAVGKQALLVTPDTWWSVLPLQP